MWNLKYFVFAENAVEIQAHTFSNNQLLLKFDNDETTTAYDSERAKQEVHSRVAQDVLEKRLADTGRPGRTAPIQRRTNLENFKEKGYVNFIGIKVPGPQDVADLFSIYRLYLISRSPVLSLFKTDR